LGLAIGKPMVEPVPTKGEPTLGPASELTTSEKNGVGPPSKGLGAL
jgi:hypothetical protein